DVVIGDSAGTGKTTLLTNIMAEAIIREAEALNPNPLDSIVAVTFTVEAARQMKENTRDLLSKYHALPTENIPNFEELIYTLETESWIITIDSLTQRILRMLALDIGIPPEVDIIDEYDNAEIVSEAFAEIALKHPDDVEFLELATREHARELLTAAFDSMSLYVLDSKTLLERVRQSFTSFYAADLDLGTSKQRIKKHNRAVMKAFARILPSFASFVERRYRELGGFTYDELRRLVVEFLRSEDASEWKSYFGARFRYLFIDEFQDTSVAQTDLLSNLVGKKTRIMIIGDPKQSIYTWRNAEPTILSDIIRSAENNKPDKRFQRQFSYHPITENFRSVGPLVEMSNYFFSESVQDSIFEDNKYKRELSLPNPEIEAKAPMPRSAPEDPPHIHTFYTNARSRKGQKFSEAEFIAQILGQIANDELNCRVRKEVKGEWVWGKPKLGDCAILIPRRGTKWRDLRALLIERNIPYVMIQDQGFYQRPEISLLIDFLDWLGDPYRNDALLRILRSPFVGASDFLLRMLSSNSFRLDICALKLEKISQKTKIKSKRALIKRDLLALTRVMNLKRNLRWSREGRKAVLLEAILQSSHFREILMTYPEGEQCVANLGLLCDTVDSWEEEEIISYPELVRRLKYYRASSPAFQSQAVLSDLENEDAIKVSTIHATKGLEFPIVFVLDVDFSIASMWSWRNAGRMGVPPRLLYEGDGGEFIHLRQLAPPRAESELWNTIASIYANEPQGNTGFMKKMGSIYDEFFSEKWRLYYVALTRARDHLFHGYNSAKGTAPTWGNEFRKRISRFGETSSKNANWISEIKGPPGAVFVRTPPKPVISYALNNALQKISREFNPSVIDPTHVYDLILCPRRYQYGSLMGATGIRCNEAAHSQFSPLFGALLHQMLEKYDYSSNDVKVALSLLASLSYVSKNDIELLKEATKEYSNFVNSELSHLNTSAHTIVSEKQIQACLSLSGRPIEMRGVIDLLAISGNSVIIYDIKSNYLKSAKADSKKVLLRKEFMRSHHEYQLLTYKEILESLGYTVDGVHVLAISKKDNGGLQWNSFDVTHSVQIINELDNLLPLEVEED
ncbi:MAG: UvrD-helicase domain-containing protein, partial [Candidatus Thorarchaeota archaeon]